MESQQPVGNLVHLWEPTFLDLSRVLHLFLSLWQFARCLLSSAHFCPTTVSVQRIVTTDAAPSVCLRPKSPSLTPQNALCPSCTRSVLTAIVPLPRQARTLSARALSSIMRAFKRTANSGLSLRQRNKRLKRPYLKMLKMLSRLH